MQKKNIVLYDLVMIYWYSKDIHDHMEHHGFNKDEALSTPIYRHGIDMCLEKINEYSEHIKTIDKELYDDRILHLYHIKDIDDTLDLVHNIEYLLPYELIDHPNMIKETGEDLSDVIKIVHQRLKGMAYGIK